VTLFDKGHQYNFDSGVLQSKKQKIIAADMDFIDQVTKVSISHTS
jgi:hypothetical protein